MKKIAVALSALATCGLFSSVSPAQNNHNVTVNFTGNVVETPCHVVGGDQTVELGDIAKSDIYRLAAEKPFELQLAGCPEGSAPISLTRSKLNYNTGHGMAQGIAIALKDDVKSVNQGDKYAVDNRQRSVRLLATVMPTPGLNMVTVGKIDVTATFTVAYN